MSGFRRKFSAQEKFSLESFSFRAKLSLFFETAEAIPPNAVKHLGTR